MPGSKNDHIGETLTLISPAHDAAALVLIDSLIHALIRKAVLSTSEAVELIEDTIDIQAQIDRETAADSVRHGSAISLLTAMLASLRVDLLPPTRP